MKNQSLATFGMAALLLCAVSPLAIVSAQTTNSAAATKAQDTTFEAVVEEITKKQPVSMYIESTLLSKTKDVKGAATITQKAKTWDNTLKGEWREDIVDGSKVKHAISKAGQTVEYQEGGRGFIYSATKSAYDNEINKTKRELQRLKVVAPDAKVAITVKEETLLNRGVYHITKKEEVTIEGKPHAYQDDLWVDKESGLILKRTYNHNQASVFQYVVDKVDFQPVFGEKTFDLSIPANMEQSKLAPEVETAIAEVKKLFPELAQFSDYDDYGVEGNWQLLKMFEAQKAVYSPTPKAEVFVVMDVKTGSVHKVNIQNPDWVSDQLPAASLAKEKASIFLKQLVGDQAGHYQVEEKVEESGGGSIVADKKYGFVAADVTFRAADKKGFKISVDKAGRIVGYQVIE